MDGEDPINTFFPDEEDLDLYAVLSVESKATSDEIKKAYRRLALVHHPDKHAAASEEEKAASALKFQQIGFAYAVLSDVKRREKYDATGATTEGGFGLDPGEDGWEAYFEQMFERVTRGKLDEMKKAYQGSGEEVEDVKAAYTSNGGSVDEIMRHIPHSTHADEPRLIALVDALIKEGELEKLPEWERSAHDEKARLVRAKAAKKEEKEAEELARELGVWDEFYGNGKEGGRKGKGKGRTGPSASPKKKKGVATPSADDEDEGDTAVLQALILKRKKNMDGFFESLAAKYAEPEKPTKRSKGKKRTKDTGDDEEDESPRKKSKAAPQPEIDDAEFEALQAKLFGDKAKSSDKSKPPTTVAPASNSKRATRSKKAK